MPPTEAHTGGVTTTPDPDVLEVDGAPRRTTRVLGIVVALVLVAGLAAWAEGVRRTPGERRAIDECATGAVDAVERAERRLGAMSSYVRPAFGNAPAEVDAGLLRLVAGQVPEAAPAVDQALAGCRDVDLWRFNTRHHEARDAWVAYLVAEQRRLRSIGRDGASYFSGFGVVSARRQEAEALWP